MWPTTSIVVTPTASSALLASDPWARLLSFAVSLTVGPWSLQIQKEEEAQVRERHIEVELGN